jgi:exodeoxyribonuclease V alpha subunit
MAESLAQGCAALPPELATPILSARPRTIHRLLGLGGPLSKPAFGAGRPLEGDLVVVDESSMVDLDLMAALLEALPPEACLVLLGDRCQLPSVEAGRILADLCAHFPANAFSDGFAALVNSVLAQPERHVTGGAARSSPVVELRHSWRFRGDEAIGLVSRAVNSGDPALALETVRTTSARAAAGGSVCTLEPLPGAADLSAMVHEGWQGLLQAKTPGEALERLTDFMCLTATNEGPHGRNGINRAMEGRLASSRVRPVIITENSPRDNLYNGYLGVLFREGQRTLAWFTVDGHPAPFLPAFLPAHDEAWAITVHKSQGSEFGRVLFLLPEPPEGSLAQANRELLYTGITRAKRECRILGSGSTFADAAANATSRRSGLAARLAALEGIRTSGR